MNSRPWLYIWLLPVVWTTCSWLNFYYPGDEYGGWAVGSLPGLWILFVIGDDMHPGSFLAPVLATGAITTSALGWIMDRLRVPIGLWLAVLVPTAVITCVLALRSFPSLERALAKNGSLQAYILPSISLGLYFAVVLTIVGVALYRALRWGLISRRS